MLQTSQDLLNIVIALCVFLFTVFVCWAIYYFARILQQAFRMIKEMRDRINKIDEVIKAFKEKIDHSTSYLLLIGEGVKKLVEVIQEKSSAWGMGDKKKTAKKK